MNDTINDRIREVIDVVFDGSTNRFAAAIGVAPSVVSGYTGKRRSKPSYEILERIVATANVSPAWLLTGIEPMITPNNSKDIEAHNSTNGNGEFYLPKAVLEVQVIPYTARAGSLGEYEQIFASDELETMLIPQDKVRHGKYFVFTVGGDSMEDKLSHGDKILARHVQRHLWEDSKLHIHQWNIWVIVTKSEGIIIKHIIDHNVDKKTLHLHSYNPIYPDFQLSLNDVVDIYNVVELVSRRL